MKGLTITKIVKKIKNEGRSVQGESKKLFPDTIIYKIFEIISNFDVKYQNTGNF